MQDSIKNFMGNCPLLSEIDVNINYLGENMGSAAVENTATQPVVKTYTDGATMRQYLFTLALRQNFGQDQALNNAAIGLLEQIGRWVEQQNTLGILPALPNGQQPISLEIVQTAWLEDKSVSNAKYQLQCRLVYYQE